MSLRIALDYDNTFSADPEFWTGFITRAKSYNHDIRIVTIRDDRFDITAPMIALEKVTQVIYTRGIAKKWFCEHFTGGFVPDIWIDDKPESILNNSTASPEKLKEWRATRDEQVLGGSFQ